MCPLPVFLGRRQHGPQHRVRRVGDVDQVDRADGAERRVVRDDDGVAADVDVLVLEVRQRQLGDVARRRGGAHVIDLEPGRARDVHRVAVRREPRADRARRLRQLAEQRHVRGLELGLGRGGEQARQHDGEQEGAHESANAGQRANLRRSRRARGRRPACRPRRRSTGGSRRRRPSTSRRPRGRRRRARPAPTIRRSSSRSPEHRGRGDRLAQHPAQVVADDRPPVPVDRVDEARAVPALGERAVEQHPRLALEAEAERQPRPLEPVARRHAVGPEAMRAVVVVVVRQRPPAGVVVLDHAHAADEPLRDPRRPLAIARRDQRLDAVHVRVRATVRLDPRPVAAALVRQRAGGLLPEPGARAPPAPRASSSRSPALAAASTTKTWS